MDEECRVSTNIDAPTSDVRPSYWLDACEDISCNDLINDFDAVNPEPHNQDSCIDSGFFGGIDQILDNIKNGADLPEVSAHCSLDEVDDLQLSSEQVYLQHQHSVYRSEITNYNGKKLPCHSNEFKCNGNENVKRPREFHESEERFGRRARNSDKKSERSWDRDLGRKRPRSWDDVEVDGRDRDQVRRRERFTTVSRKDRDCREGRGYWERDKETNDLVFRHGSWEACRNRDEKMHTEKSHKHGGGSEERKPEELKEKIPEEQARQYQLDVLEQAKMRNTIAFLETGAGKTLIAVLLIKSVYVKLQKQNKKMLAVFLVPKVPLVYQVIVKLMNNRGIFCWFNMLTCILMILFCHQ